METLRILRLVFGSLSYAQLKCGWPLSEAELSLSPLCGRIERRVGFVWDREGN